MVLRTDKCTRGVRVGIVCETANRKGAGHMKEGSVLFICNSFLQTMRERTWSDDGGIESKLHFWLRWQ